MAINAGIYVKRKYSKPSIQTGRDGLPYIKLRLSEHDKAEHQMDEMLVCNQGRSYEIELIKGEEVIKTLVFTKEEAELYFRAINAIKRSGL